MKNVVRLPSSVVFFPGAILSIYLLSNIIILFSSGSELYVTCKECKFFVCFSLLRFTIKLRIVITVSAFKTVIKLSVYNKSVVVKEKLIYLFGL